ncbi:hypothetical protein HPULCUR_010806 [Helicostylum pulchrum]|uniref:BTB domain-containing protein n=1 Tax=Helicostylum pulchrum TaxID=562976 RepID=A0ABP9YEA7_9FUNG
MPNHKTVKLNIGGTFFETTQETLRDSGYFCGLLNKNWAEGNTNNDTIFVDRDGFLFRFILLYLRTDELDVENKYLSSLKNEADFYLLHRLTQLIETAMHQRQTKTEYKLLNHEEFTSMSTIDVREAMASINTYGMGPDKKQFIKSFLRIQNVSNCPRGISIHDNINGSCGKRCNNTRDGEFENKDFHHRAMYLVLVKSDQ